MKYVVLSSVASAVNCIAIQIATDSWAWFFVAGTFWAALLLLAAVAIEQYLYRRTEQNQEGSPQ